MGGSKEDFTYETSEGFTYGYRARGPIGFAEGEQRACCPRGAVVEWERPTVGFVGEVSQPTNEGLGPWGALLYQLLEVNPP